MIQSFETANLRALRQNISRFGNIALLQLIGDAAQKPADVDVLTRDQWSSAQLGDVARGALATFGEDRFMLAGPDVTIGSRATLALTLMLHELATNAAKYGALTVPEGEVALNWAMRRDGDEEVLDLSWAERGGPPVVEPTRKGFGSRLIRMGLSGSGGVKLRYGEQGLTMEATAPLYQVQEA